MLTWLDCAFLPGSDVLPRVHLELIRVGAGIQHRDPIRYTGWHYRSLAVDPSSFGVRR